ncbi:unnamed protein product, partial [Ectocarpus sp. 12 AP-2014]
RERGAPDGRRKPDPSIPEGTRAGSLFGDIGWRRHQPRGSRPDKLCRWTGVLVVHAGSADRDTGSHGGHRSRCL